MAELALGDASDRVHEDTLRLCFERARRAGRPVAALAVEVDRLEPLVRARGARLRQNVLRTVADLVQSRAEAAGLPKPLVVPRGTRLVVLLERADHDRAVELARDLAEHARSLRLDESHRMTLSIGVAHDGVPDPLFAETLVEVAERAADVSCAAGGNRASQTDLYRIVQRRLEREGRAGALSEEARERAATDEGDEEIVAAIDAALPAIPEPVDAPADVSPESLLAARQERMEYEQSVLRDLEELAAAREKQHQQEVERLERRISKLAHQLEDAETEIVSLRRVKDVDSGVASIYRDVQGLDDTERQLDLKRELLETVFVSNRQLLEMIARQHQPG